jgi:uncharacterized membrane protein
VNVYTLSAEFNDVFTGYVLVANANENAGEKDYSRRLREEKRQLLKTILSIIVVPVITFVACGLVFIQAGTSSVPAIIYTVLCLCGIAVGGLLLWYEVDQHNPALQQICSAGKNNNCNAVLNSGASKIFGISWSVIGATYFAGSLLSLLVSGIYNPWVLFALSWLNVLALPYIFFSVYYQARIVKRWCPMCLAVQVFIALQFVAALIGGFHLNVAVRVVPNTLYIIFSIAFIIPFLVISFLLPVLRKAKESKYNKTELQRLKHNLQIFEALLAKQKVITGSTKGLGITIGSPDAKYKLIKVCSPYCGPCSKAHPIMEWRGQTRRSHRQENHNPVGMLR